MRPLMPTLRDLRDPEWWALLVWSQIYFALVRLDRAIRTLKNLISH